MLVICLLVLVLISDWLRLLTNLHLLMWNCLESQLVLQSAGAAISWCCNQLVLPSAGAAISWCCHQLVL